MIEIHRKEQLLYLAFCFSLFGYPKLLLEFCCHIIIFISTFILTKLEFGFYESHIYGLFTPVNKIRNENKNNLKIKSDRNF